jgi:hypothetical protein
VADNKHIYIILESLGKDKPGRMTGDWTEILWRKKRQGARSEGAFFAKKKETDKRIGKYVT